MMSVSLSVRLSLRLSLRLSVSLSVRLFVRLSLKISVTTEPIGFYSSGNIPKGPVVVLGYLLGVGHPQPLQKQKIPPPIFFL